MVCKKDYNMPKIKSILPIILTVALLTLTVMPVFAQPIDTEKHWANKQISAWLEQGIIQGYGNGSFQPDRNISRAEFITLINKAFNFSKAMEIDFKDVAPGDWFYEEVKKAKANGYMAGYADGTVRANAPISRQEAATILAKVLKINEPKEDDITNNYCRYKFNPPMEQGSSK